MADPKNEPATAKPDPAPPVDAPVGIDDWEHTKHPAYHLLLAGFREHLRVEGGLLKKRSQKAWDAEFKTFCSRDGTEKEEK
jgi:hypothetical protein